MNTTHEYSNPMERKLAIMTLLAETSAVLNSTQKIKLLLAHIMDVAAEITDSEAASVLLWDQKTNELRFASTTTGAQGQGLIGKVVPLEGSIAGKVLRENRVVAVDDVEQEPSHYNKLDEQIEFRTRSVLGVPMTIKERVIGVLEAVNKRTVPWTDDDAVYLSILAAQAAVAIDAAQLVSALQKANEDLSQLDKLKNDFIAIASHELRTPLGVILGYASFLQETSDTEVNEHATKVVSSALQLRQIIEDLTNLRYLQAKETDLMREHMPLRVLLRDVELDMLAMGEARKHTLKFMPAPEVTVYVDRIRLAMAMSNILNNALRFTPPGGKIVVHSEVRSSSEVWVSITDTGIGIAKDNLERIFEKFVQVENHMTRTRGGLGIGLSIAKGLVEAHGGRLWATSPGLNQGSTFTMSIPVVHSES